MANLRVYSLKLNQNNFVKYISEQMCTSNYKSIEKMVVQITVYFKRIKVNMILPECIMHEYKVLNRYNTSDSLVS